MIACFDCVSRNGDNPACEDWYGPDNSSFGSYNITYKLLNRDCRFGPFALEGYYCYKIKATKGWVNALMVRKNSCHFYR